MRKGNVTLWLLAVAIVATGLLVYWKFVSLQTAAPTLVAPVPKASDVVDYTSKDLKISLQYPRGWVVDDRYQKILVASYKTNLNRDDYPNGPMLRLIVSNASLCQKTLDQDVLLGGCGEGVNTENEILSRVTKDFPGGVFITYKIKYPIGKLDTLYYFQSGSRILQISKQPDPSQQEAEFERIVASIKFL